MDTLNKQELIELIEKLETSHEVKQAIVDFAKTYDGTNKEEFDVLMYTLMLVLIRFEELKVKAAGYDAILENDKEGDTTMQEFKEEYDVLNSGGFPPEPPVSTAGQSATQ